MNFEHFKAKAKMRKLWLFAKIMIYVDVIIAVGAITQIDGFCR